MPVKNDLRVPVRLWPAKFRSAGRFVIVLMLGGWSASCVPLVAARGGAGISNADSGIRTVIGGEVGLAGESDFWVITGTFYEGTHDMLAFGPTVGRFVGPKSSLWRVGVGAETGPVLVSDGPDSWYGGIKTNIASTAILTGTESFIPIGLSVQGQLGYRFGPDDWKGWRIGLALIGGFNFP